MTGEPLAVISFAPGELPGSVPTAVYIARNATDVVLYVGITGSLSARFLAHKRADLWWSKATSIGVEMWPDRVNAKAREDQLIAEMDPPYNRAEKWWRRGAAVHGEREDILIEMYQQGVHLNVIAAALDIGYSQCAAMVGRLRKAGRLGVRPKPPSRRRVRQAEGSFEPRAT